MMKQHREDRENLIVDEIIEGGENQNIKVVGSVWRGVKGFYLEDGKEEVLLISLYSLLNERQKERIKDEMLMLIGNSIQIKERMKNFVLYGRNEENETNDNR